MRKLLSQLWEDDGGFIISLELLFVAVILVIGIIAGMGTQVRIAMIVGLHVTSQRGLGLSTQAYEIDTRHEEIPPAAIRKASV